MGLLFLDQWHFLGPIGFWTNGFSDQWVFGPMGLRTNRLSDQWDFFGPMFRRANDTFSDQWFSDQWHFFGPMDLRTDGSSDQWVVGPMGLFRTNVPSDQLHTFGPIVFGPMTLSDQWIFGPMTLFRTNGSSDQWVFGPMGRRTNECLDQWVVRPMDCQTNGLSDHLHGSAFHASITQWEKKCFLSSNLALGLSSLFDLWFLCHPCWSGLLGQLSRSLSGSWRLPADRPWVGGSPARLVRCASVFLRSLRRRWKESFCSPFVVLFLCFKCPFLVRVTRLVGVELHFPRLRPFHRCVDVS